MRLGSPRLLIHRIPIISPGESVLEVLIFFAEDDFAVGRQRPLNGVLIYRVRRSVSTTSGTLARALAAKVVLPAFGVQSHFRNLRARMYTQRRGHELAPRAHRICSTITHPIAVLVREVPLTPRVTRLLIHRVSIIASGESVLEVQSFLQKTTSR